MIGAFKHSLTLVCLSILSIVLVSLPTTRATVLGKWKCVDCPGGEAGRHEILGAVHRSLHTELRNVYYQLSYQWLDAMLTPSAMVSVQRITDIHLPLYTPPSMPIIHPTEPILDTAEEYKVIFVEFPDVHNNRQDNNNNKLTDVYMGKHSQQIDAFLTLNPCWIPLHEPCSFNCTYGRNPKLFSRSAIFVQFPRQYSDTCKFFTALVTRQFPQRCSLAEADLRVAHPHNIGK
jgi:hypothetical protein